MSRALVKVAPAALPVPVPFQHRGRPRTADFAVARDASNFRATQSHLLLVTAFLLVTVGVSAMLVPRGMELALLRLEAGDARGALALLEERFADGDRSPALIAALAQARADSGNLDGAIALLDRLVRDRPRDRRALEMLADYYRRDGRRPQDLLRVLTALQASSPNPVRLREIAHLHGILGNRTEQAEALRNLLSRSSGDPGDYLVLARLEAAEGRPAAGAALLRRMAEFHADAIDANAVGLETSLLISAGRVEEAYDRARSWLADQPSEVAQQTAPALASILVAARRPEMGVAILEPYAGRGAPPSVVLAIAQAEIDAGNLAAALQRINQSGLGAEAGTELQLLQLRLALALGELDQAMATAETLGFEQVPPAPLAQLAAAALDANRADILERLRARGGEDFLPSDPAIAAEVLLRLGDEAAARRRAEEALRGPAAADDPFRAIRLAGVGLRLGHAEDVARLLREVAPKAANSPPQLAEIARLYIRMGRAEEGSAVLGEVRRRQQPPSSAADAAWALTATAAGKAEEVAAWLASAGSEDPFPNFLRDLTNLAADAQAYALAGMAAARLADRSGTDDDLARLAQLLVAAGRPGEALAPLRQLRSRGIEHSELYEAALHAAWRKGEPVADELRSLWSQRLAAARTPQAQGAAISALLELSAHAELLPVLRRLALSQPDRWLWAYADAAKRAGRERDVVGVWAELAVSRNTRDELRRQLAFRLLEAGDKQAAERAFRILAANARPDSADVRQLLFLWGPRPAADQLDWLEARARRAEGTERAAWMRALIERGGADRVIAMYRASGGASAPEAVRDAYLSALVERRDRAGLAAALSAELGRDGGSVEWRRRLANLAGQTGDAALEERALQSLAAAGGGGPRARRQLGLAAYRRGDLAEAERLLADHAAATGGDYETLFILGEIRTRRRDAAGARRYYEQALRRLDGRTANSSVQARMTQAALLHRLGNSREAQRIYETLLAERPHDRHLRADYVALLMELGELERARAALSAR